jgi:hypothetical protein
VNEPVNPPSPLHPEIAPLARAYARELAEIEPSRDLDARIARLVAERREKVVAVAPARSRGYAIVIPRWAAAAALVGVAVGAGILIGMGIKDSAPRVATVETSPEAPWPLPELSMWPTDSVALKIPAVYAADGTLVAVEDPAKSESTRYWVDVVVSNDGTVRIQDVVPAGPANPTGKHKDAPTRQIP